MQVVESERAVETALLSVTRDQDMQRVETEQSSSWQTVVNIVKGQVRRRIDQHT